MSITRTRFLVAAAAGAIACGGAIATATASHADSSDSSSTSSTSVSTTVSSTSTSAAGPTSPTTAPTSTSVSSTQAHLTITPMVWDVGTGRVKAGFSYDGSLFAGAVGDPLEYTWADTIVDGKVFNAYDGATLGPDARIRAAHGTSVQRSSVDGHEVMHLAPGNHTLTVRLTYYSTGPELNDRTTITASKRFTVGSGATDEPTASTQPTEPPTPSPRTTQLGVTG